MADDEKRVEECKKCVCCKLVCKFFFLSGAVFLGTFLALLLAHALTKPQFPPSHRGMMEQYHPGLERQIPPVTRGHVGQKPQINRVMLHNGYKNARPEAFDPQIPQQEPIQKTAE